MILYVYSVLLVCLNEDHNNLLYEEVYSQKIASHTTSQLTYKSVTEAATRVSTIAIKTPPPSEFLSFQCSEYYSGNIEYVAI